MMTLQARSHIAPANSLGVGLRPYAVDSAHAKARLVVLALLADGHLDAEELEGLAQRGAFHELRIEREDFFRVLYDFCADVTRMPMGGGSYLLSPRMLRHLFREVANPTDRRTLLRLIADVIESDGHLAQGEARLFRHALEAWGTDLKDWLTPDGGALSKPNRRRRQAARRAAA